jgi:hypothetical protein
MHALKSAKGRFWQFGKISTNLSVKYFQIIGKQDRQSSYTVITSIFTWFSSEVLISYRDSDKASLNSETEEIRFFI